jgi:hypothetical protein
MVSDEGEISTSIETGWNSQPDAETQLSSVQLFASLQAIAAITHPVSESQPSDVQASPSSQTTGVAAHPLNGSQ